MAKRNAMKTASFLIVASLASTRTLAFPKSAGTDEGFSTSGNTDSNASTDLPFLQFKNGGIRVNFAGFHAEAGLGGLLGGSNARGGLHAGAGTPWGSSASAGLGGALNDTDGRTIGGLHAEASFGNGGPEAAAGLGGSLDGPGRSAPRSRGGIYAGFRPGRFRTIADHDGSELGQRISGSGSDTRDTNAAVKNNVSNIQSITRPLVNEKVYLAKSGVDEPLTTLEFKVPGNYEKKTRSGTVASEKLEKSGSKIDADEPNEAGLAMDTEDIPEISYPPRRYYRKRNRANPGRKREFYKYFETGARPIDDAPAESSVASHPNGIVARQAIGNRAGDNNNPSASYDVAKKPKSATTFFDNIFNIPISTLMAVNQFLNSKSG